MNDGRVIDESATYTVKLVDGREIKRAKITRLTGYDTTVWLSNGATSAPLTAVVSIDKEG